MFQIKVCPLRNVAERSMYKILQWKCNIDSKYIYILWHNLVAQNFCKQYVYNLLDRKMTLFNAVWGKTLGSLGGKWAIADNGLGI